ncbi:MAG TPA: deoxyribonuclease V [Usitatibacter sp.]|nr:deoxyribonuclease V [Usitatibacter sp.]
MTPPRDDEERPRTIEEARALQARLARSVVRSDRLGPVHSVCGLDAHYGDDGRTAHAAAVVLDASTLAVIERSVVRRAVDFPYVPGLLSLREAPALLAALRALRTKPDLLLCDGQGIAHPLRCGLASHVGLLADLPSIGVAKTRLLGAHREPSPGRGAWEPLEDAGEEVGAVLRTREGVKPVYVSIGHRVGLATAIRWVLACSPRFRIPEPLRAADRLSRAGAARG